jgi:hypothetical protein
MTNSQVCIRTIVVRILEQVDKKSLVLLLNSRIHFIEILADDRTVYSQRRK